MLRNEKKRLTLQGNEDLHNINQKLSPIYAEYRAKGYSIEEVFYMLVSATNSIVLEECVQTLFKEVTENEN